MPMTRKLESLRALLAASFGIAFGAMTLPAQADATLDKIKERNRISIGIMVSGGPFGALDPATQKPTGFNPEVARGIADKLGVEADLVPVLPSNRVQFLQQNRVDVLVASMEWTQERSEILGFVPTPYYRNGGAALFLKSSGINRWEDLRGKPVCLSQGSNYGKPLVELYGAQLKGFKSSSESLLALRGGNCVAAVHDGTLIYRLVEEEPEWKDYVAPFEELIPSPSVVWVRKGETDTAAAIDTIIKDWHRTGWLIDTEKQVGVSRASPALVELKEVFTKNDALPAWAAR